VAAAVDATIEALVAHALEQRAEVLEELVHAELERRVGAIVDERLNGAAERPPDATNGTVATADPSPSTRHCSGCARDLAADAFSPGHYRCRECRRREWHERQQRRREQADEQELPRTDVGA
jgi:hypothetical protein